MKLIDKLNLEKDIFSININWATILAFVAFWSYGFFGALTGKNLGFGKNIVISFFLFVIFILFLWLEQKDNFKDHFIFKNKDIFVFASFFLILVFFSFGNLTASVVGDGFAHAQQSKLHSITLIYLLSETANFFDNFIFSNLIYAIDLLMIGFGFLIYKFTEKRRWLVKVIIFSALFLLFRIIVIKFGGSAGPHPPFRLFPLWLASAIFTSADFSFRLAQFAGLIGLMCFIQRIVNKRLNFINSWLFAFAVGTIPVLWHVGILVEQSIWTAIVWILFLLYFLISDFDNNEAKELNYMRWISIISIFTLLRQSAFVAFLPLLLIIFIDFLKRREFNIKKILILTSPIFLMLPFLLNNIVNGTSASYLGELSSIQRIWVALDSGIIFNAMMNSIGWPWIIFLFFPLLFFIKNSLKISAVLIFFIAGVCIFYMVNPSLWGMGRYQAEYVIPFVILGFFLFVNYIVKYYNFASKFLPIFFVFLIINNIYVFKNLASFNKPIDELKITFFDQDIKIRGQYAILSEFPYEYKQAFAEAKKAGYSGNIFVAGATYGVFGEILNNFTVLEVNLEKDIYKKMQNISPAIYSSWEINENAKIKLVLITDYHKGKELKKELENLGWNRWKEFNNRQYGSTIYGLTRDYKKTNI